VGPYEPHRRALPPPEPTPTQKLFGFIDSKEKAKEYDIETLRSSLSERARAIQQEPKSKDDESFLSNWRRALRSFVQSAYMGKQRKDVVHFDSFMKLFWREEFSPKVYMRK
jgi:predicted lipid-binding transport protein (Tim44 family)